MEAFSCAQCRNGLILNNKIYAERLELSSVPEGLPAVKAEDAGEHYNLFATHSSRSVRLLIARRSQIRKINLCVRINAQLIAVPGY
jgi:hypothetical protein